MTRYHSPPRPVTYNLVTEGPDKHIPTCVYAPASSLTPRLCENRSKYPWILHNELQHPPAALSRRYRTSLRSQEKSSHSPRCIERAKPPDIAHASRSQNSPRAHTAAPAARPAMSGLLVVRASVAPLRSEANLSRSRATSAKSKPQHRLPIKLHAAGKIRSNTSSGTATAVSSCFIL